jgi:signal transduction histidine kinase
MRRLLDRFRSSPLALQDGLLAVLLWLVDLVVFSDIGMQDVDSSTPALPIAAYAALGFVPLIWRRRAPLTVFGLLWLHAMIATQLPRYQAVMGLLAALFTIASRFPMRLALASLPVALIPAAVDLWDEFDRFDGRDRVVAYGVQLFFYALMNAGVWGTGRWALVSREREADLEYRRATEAREAVAVERARIARELHDIVAHSVTVMVLQAAGAKRILPADPLEATRALGQIEEQGREAMQELRRMLLLLRDAGEGEVQSRPGAQPGLADLDQLLNQVRRAGVSVELDVVGDPQPLASSVGLAAYRVVQEALTNVSKHGGAGAQALVRLVWSSDLRIEVTNGEQSTAGVTDPSLSTGHGILGLRERVALTGGRLEATHTPGGFRLTASIPLTDSAAVKAVTPL